MKNLLFILIAIVLVSMTSCTTEDINTKKENLLIKKDATKTQSAEVDPTTVKPPTHG